MRKGAKRLYNRFDPCALQRFGIALVFAGFALGGTFSLTSLGMGLAAFCALGMSSMLAFEAVRRVRWEQAADFKQLRAIKEIQAKQSSAQATAPVSGHGAGLYHAVTMLSQNVGSIRKALRSDGKRDGARDSKRASKKGDKRETAFSALVREAANVSAPVARVAPSVASLPVPYSQPLDERAPQESSDYSDEIVRELMSQAIHKQEVDAFVQPILDLQTRKIAHFEVFSRIRASRGECIPAARYHEIASRDKRLGDIDFLLLETCFDALRETAVPAPLGKSQHSSGPGFFLNVGLHTLRDQAFMRRLLAVLKEERDLAHRLVFEIKQRDYVAMPIPMLKIVSGLAALGVRFSIDQVQDLTLDLSDLQRFGVAFLKMDAAFLAGILGNRIEWLRFQKLRREMDSNGISLIAEKVETQDMLDELSTMALSYGQGYLFGRPAHPGFYDVVFDKKLRA